MNLDDTIVAIATPPGRGGIGVVRLAGPEARSIAMPMLGLKHELEPGRAVFGELVEPCGAGALAREANRDVDDPTRPRVSGLYEQRIDEVVVTYFAKPHSYTTDDIVEISAHGSPVVLRHIVELALARGARLAEPGEFTMRAFLNGRIDLTQAEAVRDLIDSQTLYQAKVAAQQLEGALSRRLQPIKMKLVELIALLEAGIDFAEDDVSVLASAKIVEHIACVRSPLEELARSFAYGKIVHEGLTLAIVGRPNVGKSSLFNRLVERERAIVTATPGTTRDLVTETVSLGGIPVKLVDTAGIRRALDEAESIGIQKSMEALADADLVLVVLDTSQTVSEEDAELLKEVEQRAAIVVENKADLAAAADPSAHLARSCAGRPAPRDATLNVASSGSSDASALERANTQGSADDSAGMRGTEQSASDAQTNASVSARADAASSGLESSSGGRPSAGIVLPNASAPARATIRTSALTGQGIADLRETILRHVAGDAGANAESGFLTNARHQQLVQDSLLGLGAAEAAVHNRVPHEMLLLDLYNALRPIDEITGATTTDDILNLIFSRFCIGK